MSGLLRSNPNRRRAPGRGRQRFRPRLEELESRIAFSVGIAPFSGALTALELTPPLAATNSAQVATVSATTATLAQPGLSATPPSLNARGALALPVNLGQPPAVPSSAIPSQPVAAQAPTESPAALPPDSTAPLFVLSYADYQLTRGLNPSLAAGQLPTVLNTLAVNALFEVGGNAGSVNTPPAPANTGNAVGPAGAVVPGNVLPADVSPAPADDGPTEEGPTNSIRFHAPGRPAADYPEKQPDDGSAAPQGAAPVGEPQAPLQAEAPAAAVAGTDE
jgi:hypothetical protein